MSTFTPYHILTMEDYENIQKREPWTDDSLYKPIKDISFKHFIYSFEDYALYRGKGIEMRTKGSAILDFREVAVMKAYYNIACEMNLTYFEFAEYFVGLQYTPSEEEAKWFEWMENSIDKQLKKRFNITEKLSRFQLHMKLVGPEALK